MESTCSKNGQFVKKKEKQRRECGTKSLQIYKLDKSKNNIPESSKDDVSEVTSAASDLTFIGKRIVDINLLSKQLDINGCCSCKKPLQLKNTVCGNKIGMASILNILCECGMMNNIMTDTQHFDPNKPHRYSIFDINTKADAGKLAFSKAMATEIAASGLNIHHNIIQLSYKRNGL